VWHGQSLPYAHLPLNDALPGSRSFRVGRLPLVRQQQQQCCCYLIYNLPVLWRSGAAARWSRLHTPVETLTPPDVSQSPLCSVAPRFYLRPASLGSETARGRETRFPLHEFVREILVLSRIMQASQIVEIVIVTLRPSGRCSTIKFAILSYGASLLPYLSLVLHCSVFKVRLQLF